MNYLRKYIYNYKLGKIGNIAIYFYCGLIAFLAVILFVISFPVHASIFNNFGSSSLIQISDGVLLEDLESSDTVLMQVASDFTASSLDEDLLRDFYNFDLNFETGMGLWLKNAWLDEYSDIEQVNDLVRIALEIKPDFMDLLSNPSLSPYQGINYDEFMEFVEYEAFKWFLSVQHPRTGLFLDASPGMIKWEQTKEEFVDEVKSYASVGAASTGFGLAALAIGAERGWISYDEAKSRTEKAFDTILELQENQKEIVRLSDGSYKVVKWNELNRSYAVEEGNLKITYRLGEEAVELPKMVIGTDGTFFIKNGEKIPVEDLIEDEKIDDEDWQEVLESWQKYGRWGINQRFMSFDDELKPMRPFEIAMLDFTWEMTGVITAGEYFPELKDEADRIWRNVEWNNMIISDYNIHEIAGKLSTSGEADKKRGQFIMAWVPPGMEEAERFGYETSISDMSSDETMFLNLLAIGSPAIDDQEYREVFKDFVWNAWSRPWGKYADGEPFVFTPEMTLWTTQFGHAWVDFRKRMPDSYTREVTVGSGRTARREPYAGSVDWHQNAVDFTKAFIQYGRDKAEEGRYRGIGANAWGISSSFRPEGYAMNVGIPIEGAENPFVEGFIEAPRRGIKVDTNIAPSGMAGSVAFTPIESLIGLRYAYLTQPRLWGTYGLRDSFDLDIGDSYNESWWSPLYSGLGHGVMLLSLENFRSGLIWNTMGENDDFNEALNLVGMTQRDAIDNYSFTPPKIEGNTPQEIINSLKDNFEYLRTWTDRAKDDLAIARSCMDTAYRFYEDVVGATEAMQFLKDTDSVSPEEFSTIEAFRFIAYKNLIDPKYYDLQKQAYQDLLSSLEGASSSFKDEIAQTIYGYDYEGALTQAIDYNLVRSDLDRSFRVDRPSRTASYPNLEEYLRESKDFYSLFLEDIGAITYWAEKAKNIGLDIITEELFLQNSLLPHVERLIGRKLDLLHPEGDESGFMSAFTRQTEGGLENGPNTLETIIQKIKYQTRFMAVSDKMRGGRHDLVYDKSQEIEDITGEFSTLWKNYTAGDFNLMKFENGIPAMQNKGEDRPLMYFATSLDVSGLDISSSEMFKGAPSLAIRGENEYLPILLGNWHLPNQLAFGLKTEDGSNTVRLIIKNDIGEGAAYKISNVTDEWSGIAIPMWGPYRVPWMSDEENDEWQDWLTREYWDRNPDGSYTLKENSNITMEYDNISDWSNITQIEIKKENVASDIYLGGIYAKSQEEDISDMRTYLTTAAQDHFENNGTLLVKTQDNRELFILDVNGNSVNYVQADPPMFAHAAVDFLSYRRSLGLFEYQVQTMSLNGFLEMDLRDTITVLDWL